MPKDSFPVFTIFENGTTIFADVTKVINNGFAGDIKDILSQTASGCKASFGTIPALPPALSNLGTITCRSEDGDSFVGITEITFFTNETGFAGWNLPGIDPTDIKPDFALKTASELYKCLSEKIFPFCPYPTPESIKAKLIAFAIALSLLILFVLLYCFQSSIRAGLAACSCPRPTFFSRERQRGDSATTGGGIELARPRTDEPPQSPAAGSVTPTEGSDSQQARLLAT
jgi:hypothetical protein